MEKNTFWYDMALGFEEEAVEAEHNHDTTIITTWLSKYQAYIPLFILPIFSIATYIAFIKSKYNYFEHLVINFYVTGQQMIIYWALGFLIYQENYLASIPFFLGVIYNFWCFHQIFDNNKITTKILLILLSYFLFLFGIFLIAFMIVVLLNGYNMAVK